MHLLKFDKGKGLPGDCVYVSGRGTSLKHQRTLGNGKVGEQWGHTWIYGVEGNDTRGILQYSFEYYNFERS